MSDASMNNSLSADNVEPKCRKLRRAVGDSQSSLLRLLGARLRRRRRRSVRDTRHDERPVLQGPTVVRSQPGPAGDPQGQRTQGAPAPQLRPALLAVPPALDQLGERSGCRGTRRSGGSESVPVVAGHTTAADQLRCLQLLQPDDRIPDTIGRK